jgi:hypothetical protein
MAAVVCTGADLLADQRFMDFSAKKLRLKNVGGRMN